MHISIPMPDDNLVKYIKDGLAQGRSEDVLHSMLISNGWPQKDVDDAFGVVKGAAATAPIVGASPVVIQPAQEKAKFFSWKGRIGRLRFLIYTVILYVILIIADIGILFLVISSLAGAGAFGLLFLPLIPALLAIEFWLSSFIVIKRFHDINKSGAYFWALLVPFFNIYLSLSLLLECGTDGSNEYGNDPLPPGANHNGFIARLGKSVVFKVIVTILLSAFSIAGSVLNVLHQQTAQQQIDQAMTNSLIGYTTSTPNITSSNQANATGSTNGWDSKEVYNASNPSVCYTVQYPPALIPHNVSSPGSIWFEDPSSPGDDPSVTSDGVETYIYPDTTIAAQSGVNGFLYSPFSSGLDAGVTTSTFVTAGNLNGEEFYTSDGDWYFYVAMPGVGSTTILEMRDPISQNSYNVNNVLAMAKSITPSCGH